MKRCNKKDMQEALPAFLARELNSEDYQTVESHIASCADCSRELLLLRALSEETVPDPGEVFWTAMPDRIYRAVQQEKKSKKIFDFSWFVGRITMPRWVFTSATAGIILIISVLATTSLNTYQHEREISLPHEYLVSESSTGEYFFTSADISSEQADAVNTWATKQLDSISAEVSPVLATSTDAEISDEIAELNINETERFSDDILKHWKEEG